MKDEAKPDLKDIEPLDMTIDPVTEREQWAALYVALQVAKSFCGMDHAALVIAVNRLLDQGIECAEETVRLGFDSLEAFDGAREILRAGHARLLLGLQTVCAAG